MRRTAETIMTVKYTRKQYMTHEIDHATYYGQWADELIPLVIDRIGAKKILASTDPHLNDIALSRWDALHAMVRSRVGRSIGEANASTYAEPMKPGAYALSLSDTVCAAKQAAKVWKERQEHDNHST